MKFIDILKSLKISIRSTYPYRPYFDKHECIFIHIPKAAGTSILTTLSSNNVIYRDHSSWFDYSRYNNIKFKNYYKFTIVRNPYSRIVSAYTYLKNGGNKVDDLYFKDLFEKENMTFEKFVLEYLDEYKIHEHILFKPQYLFIFDYKHNKQVDFIGKYENIDSDIYNIFKRINIKQKLKEENKTERKKEIEEYYTNKEVLNKVLSLYKKDFELLEYDNVLSNIKC